MVILQLSPAIWTERICILISFLLFMTYYNRRDSSKIEEEQISAINIRIRELENSSSYLNSKEKWKIETEQAKAVLNQAKAELKMAKEAREIRRQSSPELSEEEQASLIRESQYQKAEYKRLEKEWKKRLEELRNGSQALRY